MEMNNRNSSVNNPLTSSSATSSSASASASANANPTIEEQDARFSCNVCLDPVKDPVVTPCGHLYCWPCLFRWLKTHHTTCPVCKSGVTQENVIPIYIRGSEQDPRNKTSVHSADIPNRPQGRRIDAATQNNAAGMQIPAGMTISTSYGFFPSLFGLQFQSFTSQSSMPNRQLSEEEAQQLYLSGVLYFLTSVVILCLLFF
jgi:E3 ubiquitin-protein ligase RNF5